MDKGSDLNRAIATLIEAAVHAQSAGVYTLDQAVAVKSAIDTIKAETSEPKEEVKG